MRNPVVGVWLLACGAGVAFAEPEMPIGFFRGTFASWQGNASAGDFSVRRADNEVFVCHYDSHSYVERDRHRIAMSALQLNEPVEVLADNKPGSLSCYARIVQVTNAGPERPRAKTVPVSNVLGFTPKGDRSLAGLVIRVEPRSVTLRTRTGDQVIRLRPDTRYLNGGLRMDASAIAMNTRIFVRAGRDIHGNIEAYQVMWGEILPGR